MAGEGPRVEPGSLTCDHCGGDAITSETGLFGDGDGTACQECGFPGTVSVDDSDDDDASAYWNISDGDNGERCNRDDCEECGSLGIDERKT